MSILNIFKNLNSEQKKAVKTIHGPVLILAGAGSGKTRCLTHKIAYLISQGIMSHNILGVTFTNKAAQEMKERIIKLLDNKQKIPLISTFHALCLRILRQEAAYIKIKPRFLMPGSEKPQGSLSAPMPGKVIALNVKKGSKVKAGDVLVILEAMKMEHSIKAAEDGVVSKILISKNDQVENGAPLMIVDPK